MPAPYKPLEVGQDTAASFELLQVAEELMKDESFRQSGRVARTLVRSEQMTAVITAIDGGVEIHEHATDAPTMITVLSGDMVISAGEPADKETTLDLPRGAAAVLGAKCPHRLKAKERGAFLLVMGGRG